MLTCHELFGFMSPALAGEILTFAFEEDKDLYRATLHAVADSRKVRPIFLERQPRAQRHTGILTALARPSMELVAGNLIRSWLIKKQKAMLVDFLDALGLTHDQGAVEDLPASMDDGKLRSAVDTLLAKHPPEATAVYLNAFNDMNGANWPNLKAMLETDPRLQLGGRAA
ncbi:MAG: hypothetical protein HY298_03770 [Verrucomicrobia bacterium]|nr:hypothetical protein [Verrucomicrobiota bacterium]